MSVIQASKIGVEMQCSAIGLADSKMAADTQPSFTCNIPAANMHLPKNHFTDGATSGCQQLTCKYHPPLPQMS